MGEHEFAYQGHSLTGVDEFGTQWTVVRSSGWDDGANVRAQREVRSGADGEWDTSPLRGAREITLTGNAFAPSHEALQLSGRLFTGLPLKGEVSGESEGLILSAQAFMSDGPKFEHSTWLRGAWQLTLVAPDPLLYGPPVQLSTGLANVSGTGLTYPLSYPLSYGVPAGTTPGAVAVPNGGTATYWPTLRITGPVVNPRVTVNETGDWVRVARTLTAAQWIEIDCANRRVLLNGQVSLAAAVSSSGRWLGIPVGGASISYAANSADAASLLTINGFEGAYL